MKIVKATESDVLDLYRLQLLTFEKRSGDDWKSNGSCIDGVGRGV